MERVTGIGGVFFKADDPKMLTDWSANTWVYRWTPTVPSSSRVRDLDRLLEALRREGVEVDPKREDGEFGRFAWVMDPEGNRVELWEPPAE